ncbi:MAG: peptidoglycan DD-metalloendopeptidase family protein [Chloroflexi bacterium]|nr:peptidoglycan DD-metalloendopeptidase family protein [Chloroflexota bacterium]
MRAPSLRRLSLPKALSSIAALLALALLLGRPAVAGAQTVSVGEYLRATAALEELLVESQVLEASLPRSATAEQAALQQLGDAETQLRALIVEHRELEARGPELAEQIARTEQQRPSLEAERARLERQVAAHDVWLYGDAPAPLGIGMRRYDAARDALAGVEDALESLEAELTAAHDAQARVVDNLGRANTEITSWEQRAAAAAGQVGIARSGALWASARLASLQLEGEAQAAAVLAQFEALRRAGIPVGVALIAGNGSMPIPAPPVWPSSTPTYIVPSGRPARKLPPLGSPLVISRERIEATGIGGDLSRWTAPTRGPVTTPYGDSTPYQPAHHALDIGTALYAPVVAAADGIVEFAGLAATDNRLASYGAVVLIRHDEHLTTLYAHLDDRARGIAVNAGDPVEAGQAIGYVGLTGYTTGPHLHFELRLDNQPIDPLLLVKP